MGPAPLWKHRMSFVVVLFLIFAQGESHRFPSKGFSIEAPTQGWTVDGGEPTKGGFRVTLKPAGGAASVGASVLCAQVPQGTSARQAQKGTLTIIAARGEYGSHEIIGDTHIAGFEAPGMWVEWQSPELGTVRVVMRHVVVGQRAYLMQGHAPLDQWATQAPVFDRIFNSFTVIAGSDQEQIVMDAERLAQRCGSELDWAQDWQAASSEARETKRQVLVLVRSYPGFDLPDTSRFTTFMDEDVLALVRAEFVPLRLTSDMPAPMRAQSAYGLSPTTFGMALLLCDPDGTVQASTPHLQPEAVLPWLWKQLAEPLELPEGTAVDRLRVSLDRGDFVGAEKIFASSFPDSHGSTRVSLLRQFARLNRLKGQGPLALLYLDMANPTDADLRAQLDCARVDILMREGRFDEGVRALEPHVDGTREIGRAHV